MQTISVLAILAVVGVTSLIADTILLGDISYQPDAPVTGVTSIFLDNFTDPADLGCSSNFPACEGLNISGTLSYVYQDLQGHTQNGNVAVSPTGPGSTDIFEFDPSQITFESAVLTGVITPATFLIDDGTTFVSTGTFISDTLTADVGFATISATASEINIIPEPTNLELFVIGVLTLAVFAVRRRLT